jgi:flavin reductase (DIM6/NTAB) family NADH-FMN oxidoreductase RutF
MYLMLETLQLGGTFTRTATWDQRSAATGTRVPTGVYILTVNFNGVTGQTSTKFNLTALTPPRTIDVTLADSGRRYSLTRGARLVVQLSGPAIYIWSEPVSSNSAVLKRTVGSSANPSLTTFIAEKTGEARVTAVGSPKCYPLCLMPSRLFTIIASVVG